MERIQASQIREGVKVPDELKEAMERFELAGKKVMFAEQFSEDLMDSFASQEGDDLSETMGEIVFTVVGMVMGEAQDNMNPGLIIPLGVLLIAELAEYVEKSGIGEVSNEELGGAMEHFIGLMTNALDEGELDAA